VNTGRRTIIFAAVGLLHIGLAYALIAGLASGLIEKLPEEIKAEVVRPKDVVKPPPPPPPDLAKPPPPFVPPPEINITNDAPTNAIVTQSTTPTPPPQPVATPAPAPTPTVLSAITRTHTLPPYPDLSRKLNEAGTVTLNVTINEQGDCTDASVATSSGSQRLDDAAVQWVKARWRWNPPTQNGQPTAARTQVRVTFNLKNAG
jgi:protein TonB